MTHDHKPHLLTRRRSLALLGSSGAGLLIAGTADRFGTALARSEGHDYVADAAKACTLTAEQEEGPYYVAVDDVREDIVLGQTGVPLELEITIISSLTCKPLRHAAVDIWQCNADGVYSDISSEQTLGQTYLRGSGLAAEQKCGVLVSGSLARRGLPDSSADLRRNATPVRVERFQ